MKPCIEIDREIEVFLIIYSVTLCVTVLPVDELAECGIKIV